MAESDHRDIVAQAISIVTAMHSHIASDHSGPSAEEPSGSEDQRKLSSSVAAVPPAMCSGDGARVAQHGGATD